MEKIILLIITAILLLASLIKDKEKTKKALKIATNKMLKIGLPILLTVILISIFLYLLPKEKISEILNNKNNILAVLTSAIAGSLAVLPGFIAFPLGGVLRDNGVPYMIISSFTSTLMMVGIATLPIEKKYLGMKTALLRNIAYLFIALITAIITGIAYGELSL